MPALSTWTPEDGTLSAVAPLALACAAGTALVVDLDPNGPVYGTATLARLVENGPRRSDLAPARRGVAVLSNGGITPESAAEVIVALVAGWPHVVMRLPGSPPPSPSRNVVPVRVLSPFLKSGTAAAVYQRTAWRTAPPGPGPVLPRPHASTIRALATGSIPAPSRWIRAWREVWRWSWR